jgi:hypothetical protein
LRSLAAQTERLASEVTAAVLVGGREGTASTETQNYNEERTDATKAHALHVLIACSHYERVQQRHEHNYLWLSFLMSAQNISEGTSYLDNTTLQKNSTLCSVRHPTP